MFCEIIQNNPTVLSCVRLVCCCRVASGVGVEGGASLRAERQQSTNFANSMQILALINCLEHKHFKQKESVGEARKPPHALPRQTPSSPSLSLSNLRSECLRGSVGIYTSAAIFALSFRWVKVVSNGGRKKNQTQMFIPSCKTPTPGVKHQPKHS